MTSRALAERPHRVLALVTDAFGSAGGIAQYNRDFLAALARIDRIDEVIVLPRRGAVPAAELPPRVRQLGSHGGRFAYAGAALWAMWTYRPLDIVFCGHLYMAPMAALLARILGAPLWVQVHGTDAWQELSWLHRRAAETASLITSVSRYTRRRLLAWISIAPERVKVLANTVEARFTPGPKPQYLVDRYQARGKKVLMTVSRLAACEQYKGHDRVIQALPRVLLRHPETIYVIVGEGDDRARLEALAAEVGVAEVVRFAGPAKPAELSDHYRFADVFVMPSTGEGFGIVFLEAMACGISVIGGNQDGSLDPLADGVLGQAVDPQDGDALIAAIGAALERPSCGDDRAGQFRIAAFADQLDALVRSVLISSSPDQPGLCGLI